MLKIRLQRVGKKHEPTFRVVVCDSKRGPKSGDNIEILGSYDARDKNETKVNGERVKHWISQGAQVSDTVHNLLINLGIIEGKKINVLSKKSPIIDEEKIKAEEEAASNAVQKPETEAQKTEETSAEELAEEAPTEATSVEEVKVEEPVKEDAPEEAPTTEEAKEEKPEV